MKLLLLLTHTGVAAADWAWMLLLRPEGCATFAACAPAEPAPQTFTPLYCHIVSYITALVCLHMLCTQTARRDHMQIFNSILDCLDVSRYDQVSLTKEIRFLGGQKHVTRSSLLLRLLLCFCSVSSTAVYLFTPYGIYPIAHLVHANFCCGWPQHSWPT